MISVLRKTLILLSFLLLCAMAFAQPVSFEITNYDSVQQILLTPIRGSTGRPLPMGNLVMMIEDTANDGIDAPLPNGMPGGTDRFCGMFRVGDGADPADTGAFDFYPTAYTVEQRRTGLLIVGRRFYLRAFQTSDSTIPAGTYYSNGTRSGVLQFVPSANGSSLYGWTFPATMTSMTSGVHLVSPRGGQTLTAGTSTPIRFYASGLTGNLTLSINRNYPADTTWTTIGTVLATDTVFNWTVTGPSTQNARIRVQSVTTPSMTDMSSSNITIIATGISLIRPYGGETWLVGSLDTIKWRTSGITGNVYGQLNRNYPTGTWDTLFTRLTTDSIFVWTCTGPVSANVRVRIINSLTAPTYGDTSHSNFTITAPSITVLHPSGDTATVGVPTLLSWTSQYVPTGNVRVDLKRHYPTDPVWVTIFNSTPNDGVESWIPSGPVTTDARIRILSVVNPAIGDTSHANFSLFNPTMNITAPNGGESYLTGTVARFLFNVQTNLVGTLQIKLNRNYPTGAWELLASNISVADTAYNWTVTGASASANCRVRIVSSFDSTAYVQSANNFSIIRPTFTLTHPNGGEGLIIGRTDTIRWTSTNVTGNVRIDLNRTYPTGIWTTIVPTTTNASGFVPWVITSPATTTARMRIVSLADTTVFKISDSNFVIAPPSFIVTRPNGGETFVITRTDTIRWQTIGVSGNVRVDLNRTYPTGTWTTLFANIANVGYTPWLVTGPASTTARIRIVSINDTTIKDTSDNNFNIALQTITIRKPNGGEALVAGRVDTIKWVSANILGSMKIQLKRNYPADTVWTTLFASVPDTGSVLWTVPGVASSTARVRIISLNDTTIKDTSDANFSILLPSISVVRPNGAETFVTGQAETIRWTTLYVTGNVRIDLNRSYPTATTWTTIVPSTPASAGSVGWTVTGPTSTTSRIRIVSLSDTTVVGMSANNFTIVSPTITVMRPNGGETYYVGRTDSIRWTWTNLIANSNVRIELNRTYPSTAWTTIIASTPITGTSATVPWLVTGPGTTTARVRITSLTDTTVADTSNANFSIVTPTITLSRPLATDTFKVGIPDTVRWSSTNLVDQLTLQVQPTAVTPWVTVAAGIANSGFYVWTPSYNAVSTTARVRILSSVDTTIQSTSPSFVVRHPRLQLNAPNGGEILRADHDTVNIRFQREARLTGYLQVRLSRTGSNGAWTTLFTDSVATDTMRSWAVTGPRTSAAFIQIRSTVDTLALDTNNAAFTITTPAIALTHPNGGDTLTTGIRDTIRIVRTDIPGNVRVWINYTYPAGAWTLLRDTLSRDTMIWTPNSTRDLDSVRIRVDWVADTSVTVMSATNFRIHSTSAPDIFSMIPDEFSLRSAYPNPFNSAISFLIGIPKYSEVKLVVFNTMGQQVATVHTGGLSAGYHRIVWNARGIATGNYIVRMEAPGYTKIRMIQYIK